MKKATLLVAVAGIALFQSCSEIGPGIDFGPSGDDTAYTTDVETAQTKKILAEEFTGVSCPPCPAGHAAMRAINTKYNGNVVIIGYHIFNYAQADPVKDPKSKQDFRTDDATEVANQIFGGLKGMPEAGFDRTEYDGIKLSARPKWGGASDERAATKTTTPVNIHISSSYDDAAREVTIKVKLAYTEEVNLKQNLTVAIVEDSIVDVQKDLTTIHTDYVHEHVLRDIVTPVIGTQLPEKLNPKVPGRVYERTFKAPVGEKWHPEHCHIVAFVTNDDATSREVVQVEEVKMMGE